MLARLSLIAALAAACGGSGKKEAEAPAPAPAAAPAAPAATVRFGRFTAVPPEGFQVAETSDRTVVLRRANATLVLNDSNLTVADVAQPDACAAQVKGAAEGFAAGLAQDKPTLTIDQQLGPRTAGGGGCGLIGHTEHPLLINFAVVQLDDAVALAACVLVPPAGALDPDVARKEGTDCAAAVNSIARAK